MRRVAVALAAALLLCGLTACATTVDGTGHTAAGFPATGPSSSQSPSPPPTAPPGSGPSGSGSAPAVMPSCPTVHDTLAQLVYSCLTTGLTLTPGADDLWPVAFLKTVEPSTGWVVEEGSGNWGPPGGRSLSQITAAVRSRLVDDGGYGQNPTVTTVADRDTTIGGVKAHLLQTTMTINPVWARSQGTKVKTEHLWLVAMRVSAADDTLWYASVPDLVSNLWPKVPGVIAGIKVV